MIALQGYSDLESIYEGRQSLVFRARRTADDVSVIMKLLNADYPTAKELAKFRQQFDIARQIDIPGIIQPYSLEKYQNSLALILEDFHGEPLRDQIPDGGMPMDLFLDVAIKIADIVGAIHGRNVIHKDLKPQNIFINAQNGVVKVSDFGTATLLPREKQQVRHGQLLEGTLSYMAPEQTGRMNRSIDYRSDIYSLGVTLFQMATGTVPFEMKDVVELIHAHIAIEPPTAVSRRPDLPPVLSRIIMRCLAKTAEDRYQSAYGLRTDLERCRKQWSEEKRIDEFTVGEHDISERFQIPQKLYGRDNEIAVLMTTFDEVSKGASDFVVVGGYSGVGKSSLIHEIHKPIVEKHGYFISGKFDQYKREVPYLALIQAFQELVRQILTESDDEIKAWERHLKGVLGPNGRVITDVIPEFEHVIGPQPAIPDLPPEQSQNRFNYVFQTFVQSFADAAHPLVLFLDDLQWADVASLKLLELLVTDSNASHILIIGAYRDNEVGPSHPLMLTFDEIEKIGSSVRTISILPLAPVHLNQLIAETLHQEEKRVEELATLVHQKTNGNPFFVNEFLKQLHHDGLVSFLGDEGCWHWDMDAISRSDITDNVVELMVQRIQRLPAATQRILNLASCMGNQFDLRLLSMTHEESIAATAAELWTAMQEGLILPLGDEYKYLPLEESQHDLDYSEDREVSASYKFLHDRVQQAAYSLITEDEQAKIHLTIGRLIRTRTADGDLDERIFDIVNHLNLSEHLISDQDEKIDVCRLNLRAGWRAKLSNAHEPALRYLTAASTMLPAGSWETDYDLSLDVSMERAECEYLNSRLEDAEKLFATILEHATSKLDKFRVFSIRTHLYLLQDNPAEALKCGLQGLRLFDIHMPKRAVGVWATISLLRMQFRLRGKAAEVFLDLPRTEDDEQKAIAAMLMHTITAAYFADKNIMLLAVLKMLDAALKHGVSDVTSYALMSYSVVLSSYLHKYKESSEYGHVALEMNARIGNEQIQSKLLLIIGFLINHWREHIREAIPYLKRGFREGSEVGDLTYASYNANHVALIPMMAGNNIDVVRSESTPYMEFIRRSKDQWSLDFNISREAFISCLKGETHSRGSFESDNFDEQAHLKKLESRGSDMIIAFHHGFKAQTHYYFGDYEKAFSHAEKMHELLDTMRGMYTVPEHHFYYSLSAAALSAKATGAERRKYERILRKNQKLMKMWAENCSANYRHKYDLVAAEVAKNRGQQQEAIHLYESAIASARENEYINDEALANELAARFYLEIGVDTSASAYIANARYGYERWGADEKVRQLAEVYEHPSSRSDSSTPSEERQISETTTASTQRLSDRLDLDAMMKASQSLSGEQVLGELLKHIMGIALQNAGAERVVLMLSRDKELIIEGEGIAKPEKVTVLQSLPIDGNRHVSMSLTDYVVRTKQPVVLGDASNEGMFVQDEYVQEKQARSMLCLPIVLQGKLKGLLYLENNLVTEAFTPDRTEVLQLLATQVAIAIGQAEASIDTLTKLWVRGYFMERAQEEITKASTTRQPLSLIMIDLDHFKKANDTYGHLAGDMVLRETAARLNGVLRNEDCLGRFGGEEFILLLPGTGEEGAAQAAERLREAVCRSPILAGEHSVEQTASIGVAVHSGPPESLEELIARADAALYEAKNAGRNRVASK